MSAHAPDDRSPALLLFARAPVPGEVKTRLLGALDAEGAAALYTAFLMDLCERASWTSAGRRLLYVSGDLSHPALAQAAGLAGLALRAQAEGKDLGGRMAAAIEEALADGASCAVLIGTDSPTLPARWLDESMRLLHDGEADLVLGPAADGGYYLVGTRVPCPALFAEGVPWGTGAVLLATMERLARLQAEGLAVHLLPLHYDVDTPEDLAFLHLHLRLLSERARAADGFAARTFALLEAMAGRKKEQSAEESVL